MSTSFLRAAGALSLSAALLAVFADSLSGQRRLEREGPEPAEELLAAKSVYSSRAGQVPDGAMRKAVEHKRAMESLKAQVAGAAGDWAEYGRGPLNCAPSFCSARVDNFAYDPEHKRLFAAVGTGGIWMSEAVDGDERTLADHWVSVGDKLPTQVNGGVVWTAGTLIAAGGESVMGNNGYMGLGAFWTTDLGQTWTQSTGFPDGAQVYNARADLGNPQIVYIASSKGLFRSDDAGRSFVNVRLPTHHGDTDCAGVEDIASECQFTNMATDVIVKAPGGATDQTCSSNGCPVIAALGWRAGYQHFWGTEIPEAEDNGLYRSETGEPGTFTKLDVYAVDVNSPLGLLPQDRIGRIEMGNAMGPEQDHNYVYALVQDAVRFTQGYQPFEFPSDAIPRLPSVVTTAIGGLYASSDFGSSWVRMADTNEIALTPGSLGLLAGVQAWYNEWIAIDPTRQVPVLGIPTRMTFGLEEVFQNITSPLPVPLNGIAQSGPQDFLVIGAYSGLVGTSTHPDQHVGLYVPTGDGGVCLIVGNDGGVFKQCAGAGEEMTQLGWGSGNNDGFYALLPYGIGVAKDGTVWWGLQDNGSGHIEPDSREIIEDFGADGFFAEVDPDNSGVLVHRVAEWRPAPHGRSRRLVHRHRTALPARELR